MEQYVLILHKNRSINDNVMLRMDFKDVLWIQKLLTLKDCLVLKYIPNLEEDTISFKFCMFDQRNNKLYLENIAKKIKKKFNKKYKIGVSIGVVPQF